MHNVQENRELIVNLRHIDGLVNGFQFIPITVFVLLNYSADFLICVTTLKDPMRYFLKTISIS